MQYHTTGSGNLYNYATGFLSHIMGWWYIYVLADIAISGLDNILSTIFCQAMILFRF